MQDNTEQHLDKLAKKVMTTSSLEKPSLDFTTNLMSKIEDIGVSNTVVYKPLISKRVGTIIFVLVIAGLAFAIFGNNIQSSGWFDTIDLSVLSDNKVTETLSSFSFSVSNILMYAIVFFGLAFFIQITVLKNYHQKRLNY